MQLVHAINIIIQKRLLSFNTIEHTTIATSSTEVRIIINAYMYILGNTNRLILEKRSKEYINYMYEYSVKNEEDLIILKNLNALKNSTIDKISD